MTMPSLIAKHQEKQTVTKLKKVYSTLSQAYQLTQNEYGTPDIWFDGILPKQKIASFMNKFNKNMKVLKNCGFDRGCFPDVAYMYSNSADSYNINADADLWKFQLTDGTLIGYSLYSPYCNYVVGESKPLSSVCGAFIVDINGANKPNLLGTDTFFFYLTKYGIVPSGLEEESDSFTTNCATVGAGCTAWVIFNENMDYLKCDDLDWETKTSCSK